ncbi:MAG: bifunctional serine/threonine-protein kinase/formylglycine-generating enzyme family protein [Planctomycetota bacterium]
MAEPSWAEVREVFEQAIGLPPDQRDAFLDQRCADRPELRREVAALLSAAGRQQDWLSAPEGLAAHEPLPDQLLGKYRLIRVIGRGAMGAIVWLARDEVFDREVALKVMSGGIAVSRQEYERFRREGMSAGRLQHPNIVRVYDDGRADDVLYFAMEHIVGHDLGAELELQRAGRDAPAAAPILPRHDAPGFLVAVANLCARIADALHYAHEHGVVHRDVKPRNLLLDRSGTVFVTDFGLARDSRFGSISQSDAIVGTLYYMSPEQARVLDTAKVDRRTDVYSLGVVMYELLTLRLPFEGRTSEEIRKRIQYHDPAPVRRLNPRVPADLAAICHGAMAKDAHERYASAGDLAADLRRFLAHEAIRFRPPPAWRRLTLRARRHRSALTILTTMVLVLIGSVTWANAATSDAAREESMHVLRELASGALEDSNTPTLRRGVETLRQLTPEIAFLAPDDARVLHRLEKAYAALRQSMLQRATALMSGDPTEQADPLAAGDEARVLQGVMLLQEAALVFDDPALLADIPAHAFAPRLSVTLRDPAGNPVTGVAAYRLLDPITGQPGPIVPIGPLPLDKAPAAAGLVRVVVTTEGHGRREFTRLLLRGPADHRIDAVVDDAELGTEDMTLIPGAVLELRDDDCDMSGINNRRLEIEPFLLDRHEVSNADWRRFLSAHPGVAPPTYWDRIQPGAREDRLPVTMISWHQALAYAEWVGKRLPTHGEWALAARGTKAARLPWPDATAGEYRGNTMQPHEAWPERSRWPELYLARTVDVTSAADAATASGIFHLLGNVAEWTESLAPELHEGRFHPQYHRHIVIGDAWSAANWPGRPGDLTTISTLGPEISYARPNVGFRCARSAP